MAKISFLLCTVLISYVCEAYKILVVFPFPARSHNILGNGYVRHLLEAGHEVTYITPFPLKNPQRNLNQIDVSSNKDAFPDSAVDVDALMRKEVDLSDEHFQFFALHAVVEKTFENKAVQKLLYSSETFDVVVAEWMFNEVYSGFAAVFDCPYIWSFPYEPHANVLSLIDEATNPAYVPHLVSNNVPPFTFTQRVQELVSQIYTMTLKIFYFSKFQREVYDRSFGPVLAKKGRPLPSYDIMKHNASLMLGSSLGQAVRLPQNFKFIGGYHIEDKMDPLPEDLQKLMDNSRNGVIYFSLGSNVKSKDLDDKIKRGLVKIFGQLKQTVLWKFEEDFPGLPKNIHILKWAPQPSILSHPNCVLFITHGGLLSMTEALHFGIPVIGIPIFADQFNNVDRAVHRGFAKRVDISYSLGDDLKVAITNIINDSRYAEKAKEVSYVYHDRVASPGAELVHWVEHVVRTRGAPHLRSPALQVPLYQKMYLDLIALIITLIFIAKHLLKRLFQLCCEANKINVAKKKK